MRVEHIPVCMAISEDGEPHTSAPIKMSFYDAFGIFACSYLLLEVQKPPLMWPLLLSLGFSATCCLKLQQTLQAVSSFNYIHRERY